MDNKIKKSSVRMSSIARKISVSFNFRQLYIFLILDIVFVFFRIELWRVFTETEAMGISIFSVENFSLQGHFIFPETRDELEFIKGLKYFIPQINEAVPAVNMFLETSAVLGIMIVTEIFTFVSGIIGGSRRVRKKLHPLNRLAATAQMISTVNFDGSRFHDLEDALEKIDASQTDCHVATGNTELQGIETAINHLIDRMRKSYMQQARFVSDASHELRTPISVIQGYANMLERWGKNDEKVLDESVAAIKSESESMSRLVEQLLFLARGDNGKNQLKMENTDLQEMMQDICDEYAMVDSKHNFILRPGDSVVTAYCDYSLIKQTARILADNAVKYTPEGNDIFISAYLSEGGIPAFEIQDTGIGIAAEDIPKIFERFYRADDARNRKTGGTGLGLSIAAWIVDRHGGYFEVKSYPEAGTRITVFLPVKQEKEKPETEI